MIQVLLLILKIIGIILLALLLAVLVVLALVLFAPIRYRVRVIHNPEKTEVTGRASFLFPLVVVKFRYFEKVFTYKGRAAWYVFLESGKNKEIKAEREAEEAEETKETKESLEKIPPLAPPKQTGENQEKKSRKEKQKKEKKETSGEKAGFFDRIKRLLRQKDEVLRILSKTESKQAISFVWDKLKKTLRHILPRKVKGYLIYGSDDPATTGQVLGVISIFYAAMGPMLKIVPDFEKKRLECDLEFKGRLRVFTLLVILIKLYFNKELKKLIEEIKAIKEIE